MARRRLPIGIQTFRTIREEGYCASVFYSYFAGLGLDITVELPLRKDSAQHHERAMQYLAD